jgi:hypothetical protein
MQRLRHRQVPAPLVPVISWVLWSCPVCADLPLSQNTARFHISRWCYIFATCPMRATRPVYPTFFDLFILIIFVVLRNFLSLPRIIPIGFMDA